MQHAQKLLDAGNRVTDVAFALGMESSAAFTTFFKKQMGVTPSEYALQRALTHPYCLFESPLGWIRMEENPHGITSLRFVDNKAERPLMAEHSMYLADAQSQLSEYFSRKRTSFDLPLSIKGSAFQKSVWIALRGIPYGERGSYQQVAETIGNKNAARGSRPGQQPQPRFNNHSMSPGCGKRWQTSGLCRGHSQKTMSFGPGGDTMSGKIIPSIKMAEIDLSKCWFNPAVP